MKENRIIAIDDFTNNKKKCQIIKKNGPFEEIVSILKKNGKWEK
jgi:hypothetical protein